MSCTRFWAPKPTARPTTPAAARIGPISIPISFMTIIDMVTRITIFSAFRVTEPRVSDLFCCSVSSSPPLRTEMSFRDSTEAMTCPPYLDTDVKLHKEV